MVCTRCTTTINWRERIHYIKSCRVFNREFENSLQFRNQEFVSGCAFRGFLVICIPCLGVESIRNVVNEKLCGCSLGKFVCIYPLWVTSEQPPLNIGTYGSLQFPYTLGERSLFARYRGKNMQLASILYYTRSEGILLFNSIG